MIGISIILMFLIFPVIEGIREFYFYGINKAASFSIRSKDSDRKTMNVLTWVLAHIVPILYLSHDFWLNALILSFTVAFYRWLILDGIVNIKRSEGFFYAGNSGRTFTDKILYPLSIRKRAMVKIIPIVLLVLLYLILNAKG